MLGRYEESYVRSVEDPEGFWLEAARQLDWATFPSEAHTSKGWFASGRLNICYNALDRHVEADSGGRIALIYDSPVTGQRRQYTYAEALDEVQRIAGMLGAKNVSKGDRVVIYMPMIPQALFAMLACSRIGAIHSVVFGGFAGAEFAKRIDDAQPRVILTASCGIEGSRVVLYKPLLDAALALASHQPEACIVLQRPQAAASLTPRRDHDWQMCFDVAEPAPCTVMNACDPLFILYTSGTTGQPKGVVHDSGGYAVALSWSMENIYGVKPAETMWAASDVGWIVGHSYIVYGPLLNGSTTVIFEGKPIGTPDAGEFWRAIARNHVDVFFTAPTAVRAIRREDPSGDMIPAGSNRPRAVFLAGERTDPDTLAWLQGQFEVPIIDHWWQTETGWPAIATCLGLGCRDVQAGSAGRAVPGYRFSVLDSASNVLGPGSMGELALALPLPPGCLTGLWGKDTGLEDAYLTSHPGYYAAGDAGVITEDGRITVMGRIDDIINVAGHRLSTTAFEQIVASHPAVSECAVVGVHDPIKAEVPLALLVLNSSWGVAEIGEIRQDIIALVRDRFGPVASFKAVALVSQLPKTRSGKVLRSLIRALADGGTAAIPSTIENPSSVAEVREALASIGYPLSAASS